MKNTHRTTWTVLPVLLFLAACARTTPAPQTPQKPPINFPVRVGEMSILVDSAPPESIKSLSLEQFPAFIDNAYRSIPDRRFLFAIAGVHHLLTDQPYRVMHLAYAEGNWSIKYGNDLVGSLSELPSYAEAIALIRRWADRIAPPTAPFAPASVDEQIRRFSFPVLLRSLAKLDSEWAAGKREQVAPVAARILVRLQAQTYDRFELGDDFAGSAMALLAIGSRSTPELAAEQALLPYVLGYESDAVNASASLPVDHPVRLFVRRQTDELRKKAESSDAEPMTRFLFLRHLSEREGAEEGFAWLTQKEATSPASMLRALMQKTEFENATTLAGLDKALLLQGLQSLHESHLTDLAVSLRPGMDLREATESVIQAATRSRDTSPIPELERRLAAHSTRAKGRLSADLAQSFFQTNFYSAIYEEGSFAFRRLASLPATDRFLESLGEPASAEGREVKRWFAIRLTQHQGKGLGDELHRELISFHSISPRLIKEAFDEGLEKLPSDDPGRRRIGRLLVSRMDTRPEHLIQTASIFWNHLNDMKRFEKHYARAAHLSLSTDPYRFGWFFKTIGDRKGLQRIIDRSDLPNDDRGYALRELGTLAETGDAYVRSRYRGLLRDDPSLFHPYITYLERKKDHPAARDVAVAWLRANPDADSLERALAAVKLSAAYRHLGQTERAWAVIEPHLGTWKEDVLDEASLLLLRRGEPARALEVAQAQRDRYPHSGWSHAAVARALWSQERHAEAAREVKSSWEKSDRRSWNDAFPTAFAEIFPNATAEAKNAFTAMLDAGVGYQPLNNLASGLGDQGKWLGAFELYSLVVSKPEYGLKADQSVGGRVLLNAVSMLEKARGKDFAQTWFAEQVPPEMAVQMSTGLYQDRQFELLWATAGHALQQKPVQMDVLLAASLVRSNQQGSTRWNELVEQWRDKPSNDFFSTVVRYLLDLDTEAHLFSWRGTGGDNPASITYFVALKRAAAGDFEEGMDWLQATVEAGSPMEPPRAWAHSLLVFWQGREKSFEQLETERLF